jgi:hypothetical protein
MPPAFPRATDTLGTYYISRSLLAEPKFWSSDTLSRLARVSAAHLVTSITCTISPSSRCPPVAASLSGRSCHHILLRPSLSQPRHAPLLEHTLLSPCWLCHPLGLTQGDEARRGRQLRRHGASSIHEGAFNTCPAPCKSRATSIGRLARWSNLCLSAWWSNRSTEGEATG